MPTPVEVGSFSLWPSILGIGATLIGLVVGFLLNELSSVIRSSHEDRRTIGKALAELMEVRHHLKTMPLAIGSLKASLPGPITPYDEFMLRKAIWFFLPNTEGLQKRYEDAVTAVAGEFPILAFDLRSKDAIGPLMGRLRGTLPIDPKDAQLWLKIEDELVHLSIPKLDELILELSKLHRRKTTKQVEAILEKPFEKPKELVKFFADNFALAISAAQAKPTSADVPQAAKVPGQPT
jgi:hypothetical protein